MSEANGEDDPAEFHGRLDDTEEALAAAETEADLDAVESDLDAIEGDLAEATLPEPPNRRRRRMPTSPRIPGRNSRTG